MHSRNNNTAEPQAITAMAQLGNLSSDDVMGSPEVEEVTGGVDEVGITGATR